MIDFSDGHSYTEVLRQMLGHVDDLSFFWTEDGSMTVTVAGDIAEVTQV